MLDENNHLVQSFRMVRDASVNENTQDIRLRLVGNRSRDGRMYNLPTASEVAILIVGDVENLEKGRDIIVEYKNGSLQRINELHPSYLALQYPLFFPYGEDGYIKGIEISSTYGRKRCAITMREWFQYRIQNRMEEPDTNLCGRKLLQQFLVDAYTMVESERLHYIRTHQKNLRVDLYNNLSNAILTGEITPSSRGKRVIIPSSFTGGAKYMMENYQDAMVICRWAGFPELFITFTCNPKWPEIIRAASDMGLKPEECPIDICRVFKMKLDHLVKDLIRKNLFGRVKASKFFL